jgi:small subunit ribosomal protein S8
MSITDSVADFVVALKNSSLTGKIDVITPFSNLKLDILKVLKKEGFIEDYTHNKGKKANIVVKLKYYADEPAIKDTKKMSKGSRRIYVGKDEIPEKEGNRIWLISTSKGILTGEECREKGVGGELLFYIE